VRQKRMIPDVSLWNFDKVGNKRFQSSMYFKVIAPHQIRKKQKLQQ
jgi:hypothetical protein